MSELDKLTRQELLAELKHCHHEQMQYANENADLKRQNAELQAQCAAMRGALVEANEYLMDKGNDIGDGSVLLLVEKALSTSIGGKAMKALTIVVEADCVMTIE